MAASWLPNFEKEALPRICLTGTCATMTTRDGGWGGGLAEALGGERWHLGPLLPATAATTVNLSFLDRSRYFSFK
jgi:hypothetical protein